MVGVSVEDEEPTVVCFRQHCVAVLSHTNRSIGHTTTARTAAVVLQRAGGPGVVS